MRLSPIDQFTPELQRILVRTLGPDRAPPPPFVVWAHSPGLCDWVEGLGAYCRDDAKLPKHLRILSMLITGRHFDSPFMWNAHYAEGVAAGLDVAAVDQLARGDAPNFSRREDQVFYEFARQALEDHFVDDDSYAAAVELFGEEGVLDLIGCVGLFSMSAMMLNVFEVDMPPEWGQPFEGITAAVEGHDGPVGRTS